MVGGLARTLLAAILFAAGWLKLRGEPSPTDVVAAVLELCAAVLVAVPVRPGAGVLLALGGLGCGALGLALVRLFVPLRCGCLGHTVTWRPWQHLATAVLLIGCVLLLWRARGERAAS